MRFINIKNQLLKKAIFTPKPTTRVYLGHLGNTQYIVIAKNLSEYKNWNDKTELAKIQLAGFNSNT